MPESRLFMRYHGTDFGVHRGDDGVGMLKEVRRLREGGEAGKQ